MRRKHALVNGIWHSDGPSLHVLSRDCANVSHHLKNQRPFRDLPHSPKSAILGFKPETDHQKGQTPSVQQGKAVVMIRLGVVLVALFGLSACGGGSRYASGNAGTPVLYATGPIQKACQSGGRRAASRVRCGCIQAVADRELSGSDQRRGARYFRDPHQLQQVRQNQDNNASNRRFWAAWKAFGQTAARLCSGT